MTFHKFHTFGQTGISHPTDGFKSKHATFKLDHLHTKRVRVGRERALSAAHLEGDEESSSIKTIFIAYVDV